MPTSVVVVVIVVVLLLIIVVLLFNTSYGQVRLTVALQERIIDTRGEDF